ncbi:hypothetical protein C0Z17_14130 [Trinickia caryophylli]|nr:hypothetical protein C0Z17_14130 [Trinickia caryophylli]
MRSAGARPAGRRSTCVARASAIAACAAFATLAALVAAAPVAAQKASTPVPAPAAAQAPGGDETSADERLARTPPEQAAAPAAAPAAKAADRRLQGVADERALLGAPSPGRDPYRAALDAHETQQTDLMRAERMPNRALEGNGYDAPPAAGRKPRVRMPADAGNAPANTPQDAAQAVYRESFKDPRANAGGQQVYRMPW